MVEEIGQLGSLTSRSSNRVVMHTSQARVTATTRSGSHLQQGNARQRNKTQILHGSNE
jgi:hypothetical protein